MVSCYAVLMLLSQRRNKSFFFFFSLVFFVTCLEGRTQRVNQLIIVDAVCREAPATTGLSKTLLVVKSKKRMAVNRDADFKMPRVLHKSLHILS